jgi:NADH-quinone oxidoreductase subunit H
MHDFNLIYTLLTIAAVMGVILGTCALLIYLERKVSAWIQDRLGPNRVGPYGLFQSVADGLKFLFKEDIIPGHVDKLLFLLAPALVISTALLAFAVVPFGATSVPPEPPRPLPANAATAQEAEHQRQVTEYEKRAEVYRASYQFMIAPNINIGVLFVFAIASLNVYGIILGGWSANNKYSMLGALRSSAQIVSYEIPMGLSVLGVILMTGSLNLERVIHGQASTGAWNVFYQPLAFLLFLVSTFAECNRLPFDLPEAEQELVGGYHTEYSAMKFALFFLAEYSHMITTSFLTVILFFGGWHLWFVSTPESHWLVQLLVFAAKMAFFIVFFMVIRWTIPRFRFDQLMGLAWKVMIPLALVCLVFVMVVKEFSLTPWLVTVLSFAAVIVAGLLAARPAPTSLRAERVMARSEVMS